LTYFLPDRMVSHMKTTLVIDDTVLERLRQEAARQGRTISELVEAALRSFLERSPKRRPLPPLPSFDSGGAFVDISDREALYQAMEGR
jgi:Ribbon-helix-helix protein, copG family